MDTILNIALLLVGAASTLTAFGGKTWSEGGEHLSKRITARGWLSLICLVLALAVGIIKELHTRSVNKQTVLENKLEATEAKAQADKRQSETQNKLTMTEGQLAAANAKLGALEKLVQLTQDQITGGNGFPIAIILWAFPDKDGSFPLEVTVQGNAPLDDMNYSVTEGTHKRLTPQEVQQMAQQSISVIYGHSPSPEKYFGHLNPHTAVPLGYAIRPNLTEVNTYRIGFRTRNRSVQETLDVRFNAELKIWQYRYLVKSEDTRDPNKVLAKQDWAPKKNLPILYGEGPP